MVKDKLNKWLQYSHMACVVFLVCTLPFYYSIAQQYALIFSFATYAIEYIINKRWNLWQWDSTKPVFIAMMLFFLLMPAYHLFEQTDIYLGKQMETRLAFAVMALMGFCGTNRRYNTDIFGFAFVIVATALSVFVLVKSVCSTEPGASLIHYQYTATVVRNEYINNHMVYNQFLCIALCFIAYFALKYSQRWLQITLIVCFAFMYASIFLSEGRAGFLAFHLVIAAFASYILIKRSRIIGSFAMVVIFAAVVLLIGSHQQLNKNMSQQDLTSNPRLPIWNIAFNMIKERPVFGYGVSDASEIFIDRCIETYPFVLDVPPSDPDKAWRGRNIIGAHAHNTFLQTTMEFGIFGLCVFLSIFILTIRAVKKRERLFVILFFTGWITQACFEVFGCGLTPITFCIVIYTILCGNPDSVIPTTDILTDND